MEAVLEFTYRDTEGSILLYPLTYFLNSSSVTLPSLFKSASMIAFKKYNSAFIGCVVKFKFKFMGMFQELNISEFHLPF